MKNFVLEVFSIETETLTPSEAYEGFTGIDCLYSCSPETTISENPLETEVFSGETETLTLFEAYEGFYRN